MRLTQLSFFTLKSSLPSWFPLKRDIIQVRNCRDGIKKYPNPCPRCGVRQFATDWNLIQKHVFRDFSSFSSFPKFFRECKKRPSKRFFLPQFAKFTCVVKAKRTTGSKRRATVVNFQQKFFAVQTAMNPHNFPGDTVILINRVAFSAENAAGGNCSFLLRAGSHNASAPAVFLTPDFACQNEVVSNLHACRGRFWN